jgi:poly(glycerol-phosphate) alpha-glucosyltransferase
MMRVAHFVIGRCNPDSANGVDQAVYSLSRAQAARGNTVAVFELTDKDPMPIPDVEVSAYVPGRYPFQLPESLRTALRSWKPAVVHLHSIFSPPNEALAAWLRRQSIPFVVTPHGSLSPEVLRRNRLPKLAYKWIFELPVLNAAAFVHAVGEHNGVREYGVRVPVVVAPNGIDLASIPTRRDESLLAGRFPTTRGKRIFMYLGRLDRRYKGLDLLLHGLARAALRQTALLLVGPDYRRQRQALVALARRLGIESQVIFAGPAYGRTKYDLLAGADVLVLPSRSEGLPLAVLEASGCGKPSLVSTAANPGGLLDRYEAGLVVAPRAADIGEGFARLARIPESDLRRMGRNARRMVEEEFRWEKTAAIIQEGYETHARNAGG